MIRHVRGQGEALSFLSFLDVMSCTIGVLLLILVGVVINSFWSADQILEIPSEEEGIPGLGRIYVECSEEGLLVHPEEIVVSLEDLDDPERWLEGPFGRCLVELRSSGPGGSVHFLVRDGGLALFRKAMGYAIAAGGGTIDDVTSGRALFSIGQQTVIMPGSVRVVEEFPTLPDSEAVVPGSDGAVPDRGGADQ